MRILLYGLMIIFLLKSCNQDNLRYEYYDDGAIKELKEYENPEDTSSYKLIQYYKNGHLKRIIHFSNGKPTGKYYTYYENGQLRNETTYNDGKLHGINRIYNNKGFQVRESLYIDDEQKIFQEYLVNSENQTKMQCYAVNNGKAIEIGQIIFDNEGNILLPQSFYYNIEGSDTITRGQNYHFEINALIGSCSDSCNIKLKLGELDSDFNFRNVNDILTSKSKNSSLQATLETPQLGYNLIMGMLYVRNKSESIANFVVYKEFYVKE